TTALSRHGKKNRPATATRRQRARENRPETGRRSLQLGGVEDGPVVEVVEVDGVLDGTVVLAAGGGEDLLPGAVGVDVPLDGGVELVDRGLVEGAALLVEDPLLQLDVGRLGPGDEGLEGA